MTKSQPHIDTPNGKTHRSRLAWGLSWLSALAACAILCIAPVVATAQAPSGAPAATVKVKTARANAQSDDAPSPIGGFLLGKGRVGLQLELGYPFLDFQFSYGATRGLQILGGYRGMYSLTSAGYAGLKVRLMQNRKRTVGVAMSAIGGYSHVRDEGRSTLTTLSGGHGGFGEIKISATVRRGRHALNLDGGARVSQVLACTTRETYGCSDHPLSGSAGVLTTAFVDLGWSMRMMKNASYYLAAGVDMFANSEGLPAMVRFRTGVMLHF